MTTRKHQQFFGVTLLLIVFLSLLPITRAVAQKRCISGYVSDKDSHETLIGATVIDRNSGHGCVTNNYGFYSLTLGSGEVALEYSYVGYESQTMSFTLVGDTTLSVKLESNILLNEVTVTSTRSGVSAKSPQMSIVELPVKQIQSIPTLFGEADVLKAIQLLPGVQNGVEGSAGMYVRGGGPDENLLLLDGTPVYNVNHALGFFSVFNPDALKNVTLYKGCFPARFGGRLSSVVDIRMKEGDMQHYHGNVSIGLISSKLNVEGPIVKDKLSFNISARRSYADLLIKPAMIVFKRMNDLNKLSAGYYFYDINAKLNWKISDRDRLLFSFYGGDDVIYAKIMYASRHDYNTELLEEDYMKLRWKWGNKIAALRWNHLISQKMFMNATVNYTQYRHNLSLGYEDIYSGDTIKAVSEEMRLNYNSGIHDVTAKVEFDYSPVPTHEIKFGGGYTFHVFRPEVQSMQFKETNVDTTFSLASSRVMAHETSLYAEDNITITPALHVNAGLHYSTFTVNKHFYHSLQPRLSMSAMVAKNVSIKAGYAYMSQYVHLLSNSNVSLPTDLWVPVTEDIPPMKSHQLSLGVFWEIPNLFDVSVEGYYKYMKNLLEYRDGSTFFGSSEGWDKKVCIGNGWAYGIELLLQRSFGKTTGWIGYTWAHANRRFDREGQTINDGNVFPSKYDRRHDVSITVQHKFSEKIDIAGTWVFSTGNCGTLGLQHYAGPVFDPYWTNLEAVQRNNYRFNNYHRLDLSVNFNRKRKYGTRTWNISVYNAYNHNNPFLIYTDYTDEGAKLKQLSIFPIIPSVSYGYRF